MDILLGSGALVVSTFLLVTGALNISTIFGLDQFYVGLTIVALGCVVPEVAKLGHNINRAWGVMMLATAFLAFVFQTSCTIV